MENHSNAICVTRADIRVLNVRKEVKLEKRLIQYQKA